jgi:hypothetical protein
LICPDFIHISEQNAPDAHKGMSKITRQHILEIKVPLLDWLVYSFPIGKIEFV